MHIYIKYFTLIQEHFLIAFLETEGGGRERKRNINVRKMDWLPLIGYLTRDQTYNLGTWPD